MKYCHSCHRLSAGDPPFCNSCSSSFNVRLCPRQHINSRSATACSQCGSKDLSQPAPKIPILFRLLLPLLRLMPGIILLGSLIIFFGVFAKKLLEDPNHLLPLMCIGFLLSALLALWVMLPSIGRKSIRSLFKGRGGKHD